MCMCMCVDLCFFLVFGMCTFVFLRDKRREREKREKREKKKKKKREKKKKEKEGRTLSRVLTDLSIHYLTNYLYMRK